jgi:hypothetical protein
VDPAKELEIRPTEQIGYLALLWSLFQHYPSRSVLTAALMITQSCLYNAIFFTYGLVLEFFFHVKATDTAYYFMAFAAGNPLGPLTIGRLFDTAGRRKMISGTYLVSGVLLIISAQLFKAGALNATTQTICWAVIFAADLGVDSARDALAALRDGEAVLVDLGRAGDRPFVNTSSTGVYVDMVNARRQLDPVLGKRLAEIVALIGVLRGSRPHELVLDGKYRRLWLYFAGNCRYEPRGMAPAYRPHLADGCLDIRVVEATVLARSRLVAAVLTGTLARSRVYRSRQAGSVDVRAADGQPIWLSTDGEVATAETGLTHGRADVRTCGRA